MANPASKTFYRAVSGLWANPTLKVYVVGVLVIVPGNREEQQNWDGDRERGSLDMFSLKNV